MATYLRRAVEPVMARLLSEAPALHIVGPRAVGKTTTASRYAATIVQLDQPTEAAAFRADPDAALRGLEEPVLLDEWQAVPEVLGAVKRAVDEDPRPGRFVLTGSVRAELEAGTWPGTGRLIRVPLYGLTVAEQIGRPERAPLLDLLAQRDEVGLPSDPPDLRGYVEMALRGGFPEPATSMSAGTRSAWFETYVDSLLTRDVAGLEGSPRDPMPLRRYFEAYALNSAGVVHDKTLYEAAGINRKTAIAYEHLLARLYVVEAIPAWTSNRLKRLVRSPKRYLIDAALLAGILRIDENAVLRDGDLLGRLLDTFVLAQLRGELAVAETRPRLYHVREEHGRQEVDLIAELGGGGIIAIEVKASAAPDRESARHLVWLREKLGDRFVAGAILHTGRRAYRLEDRVSAIPIACLWG